LDKEKVENKNKVVDKDEAVDKEITKHPMPRPRMNRLVDKMPLVTYFKPAGIKMRTLQEVVLNVDEFEAIRLKDFEELSQEEAAKKMGLSQPTFHRLIASARKKTSDSITNGKALRIKGGDYKVTSSKL
jgi:uncharacterized protein